MGCITFERIVHILAQNPIFMPTGHCSQRPVRYQLACFLMHYGARGCDATGTAHKMGIGEGTVFLYCRRVTWALRQLGIELVSWGNQACRQVTAEVVERESGLPNCLGMLDGTLIRLTEAPKHSGAMFYCHKHFPAVSPAVLEFHY